MKLNVTKIVNAIKGCGLVMGTAHLPGEVALAIPSIEKQCKKAIELVPDVLKKLESEYDSRIEAATTQEEIQSLQEEKKKAVDDLYATEYEIDVKQFKASDFFAKKTIKFVISVPDGKKNKQEIVEIPEGQSLVPPMFFALMDDFIIK